MFPWTIPTLIWTSALPTSIGLPDLNLDRKEFVDLPHKDKMQYVHIVDTSIKHQISGRSTSMLKMLYVRMFDNGYTPFSYGRELIIC